MKNAFTYLSTLLLVFATLWPVKAQKLEKQFDELLTAAFPDDGPGATALVAKDGRILYQKAFGMANLELDVKMRPDMVFEIGSITKQFTAVAILMLMEEGKLALEDDITNYLPDYPTHGHQISIHHLLTHTSGIKSYTSMEKWTGKWRQDFEPLELIDFFKNEPMDFAPGDKYLYNNSAYFILGYIIEKASGQSYEKFIETRIFEPLGMEASRFGSKLEIIKNRAYGYQKGDAYSNAEYLSMTQPYAAGSLMSTVGDLLRWNRAIRANSLVKKETIDLAFTNYTLNNGEPINYGYGWGINEIGGSPTLEHSGGIFGYLTNGIYLPQEDVFVAVFSNCGCNGPGVVSTKMAALAIGKPYPAEKEEVPADPEFLQSLVGVYDFEDESTRMVSLSEGTMYSQRTGGNKFKIFHVGGNTFQYVDGFAQITFQREGDGVKAVFTNRINRTTGVKTDRPIPQHTEIPLEASVMERYTGVYQLAPGFDLTITLEDGKLMSQATGQSKVQLFPESETRFFLKVVDAQIAFKEGDDGMFDSLVLYQGGREVPGKRKEK